MSLISIRIKEKKDVYSKLSKHLKGLGFDSHVDAPIDLGDDLFQYEGDFDDNEAGQAYDFTKLKSDVKEIIPNAKFEDDDEVFYIGNF